MSSPEIKVKIEVVDVAEPTGNKGNASICNDDMILIKSGRQRRCRVRATETEQVASGKHHCNVCNKSFVRKFTRDEHMRHKHSDDKPYYRCAKCKKNFSCMFTLRKHKERMTHTGILPYKCTKCEDCFGQQRSLVNHMRKIHLKKELLKCENCNQTFTRKESLKLHVLTIHSPFKAFQCQFCGRKFRQKGNLKLHIRTHTGEKPYTCQVCRKSFSVGHSLKIHYRKHTGDRPFKCKVNDCTKAFADGGALKKHTLACHSVLERLFKCKQCPKSFRFKHYLINHIKFCHNNLRPFGCDLCTATFKQKAHLGKHMDRIHNGKKVCHYRHCPQCGKNFRLQAHLANHIRLVHGPKKVAFRKPKTCIPGAELDRPKTHDQHHCHKFKCDLCDHSSLNSRTLRVHKLSHTATKSGNKAKFAKEFSSVAVLPRTQLRASILAAMKNNDVVPNKESLTKNEIDVHKAMSKDKLTSVRKPAINMKKPLAHGAVQMSEESDMKSLSDVLPVYDEGFKPSKSNKVFSENNDSNKKKLHQQHQRTSWCVGCNTIFFSLRRFKGHMCQRINLEAQQCHKCKKCMATFTTKNSLGIHTKYTHLKKHGLKCNFCDCKFTESKSLKLHMSVHDSKPDKHPIKQKVDSRSHFSGKSLFTCKECATSFVDNGLLERHVLSAHVAPKNLYKCQHCPKEFKCKQNLEIHLKTVHNKRLLFTCDLCQSSFRLKHNLSKHVRYFHNAPRTCMHSCDQCGNECWRRASFGNFRRRCYSVKSENVSSPELYTPLEHTEQAQLQKCRYKISIQRFTYFKTSYTCEDCEKVFCLLKDVEVHTCDPNRLIPSERTAIHNERIILPEKHANDDSNTVSMGRKKNHCCELCGKTFELHTSYTRHLNLAHPRTRELKCNFCNEIFSTKRYLQKHINDAHAKPLPPKEVTHRSTKQLKCKFCESYFSTKRYLQKHVNDAHDKLLPPKVVDHSSTEKLKCNFCESSFATKRCLQKHTNDAHAESSAPKEVLIPEVGVSLPVPAETSINEKGKVVTMCAEQQQSRTNLSPNELLNFRKSSCNHLLNKCELGSRKCKHCKMSYEKLGCLFSHIKLKHSKKGANMRKSFGKRIEKKGSHVCVHCDRIFKYASRLKAHISTKHRTNLVTPNTQPHINEQTGTDLEHSYIVEPSISATCSSTPFVKKHNVELVNQQQFTAVAHEGIVETGVLGHIKCEVVDNGFSSLGTSVYELADCFSADTVGKAKDDWLMKNFNPTAGINVQHGDRVSSDKSLLPNLSDGLSSYQHSLQSPVQTIANWGSEIVSSLLRCTHCAAEFMQADHLLTHVNREHCQDWSLEILTNQNGVFECTPCPAESVQADYLLTHVNEEHSNAVNTMDSLSPTQTSDYFQQRSLSVKCELPANNGVADNAYIVPNGWFQCDHCGAEFVKSDHLSLHTRVAHSDESTGGVPNATVVEPRTKTKAVDGRKGIFECKYCDAKFAVCTDFLTHVDKEHNNN